MSKTYSGGSSTVFSRESGRQDRSLSDHKAESRKDRLFRDRRAIIRRQMEFGRHLGGLYGGLAFPCTFGMARAFDNLVFAACGRNPCGNRLAADMGSDPVTRALERVPSATDDGPLWGCMGKFRSLGGDAATQCDCPE